MEQLSKRVGKTLPKGSSDPLIVTVGRELVAEHGKDILKEIAKLHFKTTEVILQEGAPGRQRCDRRQADAVGKLVLDQRFLLLRRHSGCRSEDG